MKKMVNQIQIHYHKNNYNTELFPCQVYNPLIIKYSLQILRFAQNDTIANIEERISGLQFIA